MISPPATMTKLKTYVLCCRLNGVDTAFPITIFRLVIFLDSMEFREIQKKVVQNALNYGEQFKVTIDKNFAFLKFIEEVGEFAQALLIHEKKSRPEKFVDAEKSKKELAKELADVIGMAIVNAHLLDIDIESALEEKWITKK